MPGGRRGMKIRVSRFAVCSSGWGLSLFIHLDGAGQSPQAGEELFLSSNQVGHYGGHLVVSLRSESEDTQPCYFARYLIPRMYRQMTGDLIHINRLTQDTEPALAKTWQVSPQRAQYTLHLGHGLRFLTPSG